MKYNGTIYRPPVEYNTSLLPITEGCTHNSCSFCNMYQDIPFRMLPLDEVEDYLQETCQRFGKYAERIRRVYLVGADPFALSAARLLERIDLIRKHPLDSVKLDGVLGEEKQQMLDVLTHSLEHVDEGQIRRTSRLGTL